MADEPTPAPAIELLKEVAKDAYADGLQPGVREGGKSLQTIGLLLNRILAPIRRRLIESDMNDLEQELHYAMAKRQVRAALVDPPPNVAYPAIQNYLLCEGIPELRRMYVELLVTAMDPETAPTAHPSFARTLQDLTADEVRILNYLALNGPDFIAHVFSQRRIGVGLDRVSLVAEKAHCQFPERVDFYISNLIRLAIVRDLVAMDEEDAIPSAGGTTTVASATLEALKGDPRIAEAQARIEAEHRTSTMVYFAPLLLSDYGRLLATACGALPPDASATN